jgi:tetratricopeptide (TPR) repeat protein
MKKMLVLFLVTVIGIQSYSQAAKDKMPITTSSNSALASYNEGVKCFEDVAIAKAFNLLQKSLTEDPEFFMANYQLATYYQWFGNQTKFKEYADAAVNCKTKLSPAEELLREALARLKENQNADVTEVGEKLVKMFPKDVNSFFNLYYFQSCVKDTVGAIETLNKALKIAENPAPIYNQLGYVYMRTNKIDKAEAAFNKYIDLAPKNPNVYDSKGDFYMKIKDYDKAYDSYMKAYALDTAWSYSKAQKAKQLFEGKQVK